jgi:glycosyltransferase involved in cell wall biosynthesis
MISAQVSVVIPVYNSSLFLENAVKSALSLSEVGEILLVEDGSIDNSFEKCLELQKSDNRIKVLVHEKHKNKGAADSRNLGILNASLPLIAFLDSDDIYYPNRFHESIQILGRNSEVQGVFGKVLIKNIIQDSEKVYGVPFQTSSNELLGYLLNGGYFHTNTLTVRKSFFKSVGYFNPNFWPGEDVEMWIRMAFLKGIVPIESDIPIAEYRIHGENLSLFKIRFYKLVLWKSIFVSLFFKNIGFRNRWFILKQVIKSLI